jgi:hypothetical protein
MIGPGGSIAGTVCEIDETVGIIDGKVDNANDKLSEIDSNVLVIDERIGDYDDLVHVPFDVADLNTLFAYLKTGYYHVHGASFLYPDKADPVLLTSSAAAWSQTGDITQVIPAGVIAKPFDLHWCSVWAVSDVLYGVVDIFAGPADAPVKIGAVDVGRTANFSRESNLPVQIPQQPAGTRISCRFSDGTTSTRTVRVKFYGHVYATTL